MSKSTQNGSSLPSGWESWPTMLEATRELGCHHTTIRRLIAEGLIDPITDPHGKRRFPPNALADLKGYVADMPEDEKAPTRVGGITHEEFAGATSLVKQVHQHHERMIPLLINAWESVMRTGREQADRDAKRISELETMRDAAVLARETSLSQEHDRALAETVVKAGERRKERAFEALMTNAVPVIVKKLGLESDPMIGTALSLFKSLKREQILLLCSPMVEFVTPEQRAQLLKLLGELSPEEKQGLGMAETPQQKEKT